MFESVLNYLKITTLLLFSLFCFSYKETRFPFLPFILDFLLKKIKFAELFERKIIDLFKNMVSRKTRYGPCKTFSI